MRIGFAAFLALFAIGCATPKAWRPTFDARCDCQGSAKKPEAVASDDIYKPDESLLDAAKERLGPADAVRQASVVVFLDRSANYDAGVEVYLAQHRQDAERAARWISNQVGEGVTADLLALRHETDEALEIGDQSAAIEAQSLAWARYDEGVQILREKAELAARTVLPPPKNLIDQTCGDVGATLFADLALPGYIKTCLVRERLAAFLVARYAERRDAAAAEIANAIVTERRPRLLATITK